MYTLHIYNLYVHVLKYYTCTQHNTPSFLPVTADHHHASNSSWPLPDNQPDPGLHQHSGSALKQPEKCTEYEGIELQKTQCGILKY